MGFVLSDNDISRLMREPKKVRANYPSSFPFRSKGSHYECEFEIETHTGHRFQIKVRQSSKNPLDFSIILVFNILETGQSIRLVRYNGKSHEHSNPIEKARFYDFHIHKSTERYMAPSWKRP